MKLPWLFLSLACACAAPPPPRPAAAPTPEPAPERWGEVEILQRHPALGEIVVPHGSALHSGDEWAIRVRARRTAFARLSRVGPNGKTTFDTDLGRVTEDSGVIRVPTAAGVYLQLDSAPGTEYVVLMLADAPLEPEAVAELRGSVLGADPPASTPRKARKPPKRLSPQPSEPQPAEDTEPYRVLPANERAGSSIGPYLEVAGGRRAAAWIRFEHRRTEKAP